MAPGNFLFPEAPLQPCVLDISRESINGAHWKNPLDVVHTKRLLMLCMASVEGLHQRADHQVHWMEEREGN